MTPSGLPHAGWELLGFVREHRAPSRRCRGGAADVPAVEGRGVLAGLARPGARGAAVREEELPLVGRLVAERVADRRRLLGLGARLELQRPVVVDVLLRD